MAQPATTFRSDVGGYRPMRVIRLEHADSARIAPTKGENAAKYGPMFSRTRPSVFSTTHSASR